VNQQVADKLRERIRMRKEAGIRTAVGGWLGRHTGSSSLLEGASSRSLEEFHAAHAKAKAEIGALDSAIGQKNALIREMPADSPQAKKLQREIADLTKKRTAHVGKVEKAFHTASFHGQHHAVKAGNPEILSNINSRKAMIDELKGGSAGGSKLGRAIGFVGKHKWKLLGAGALGAAGLYALKKKRGTGPQDGAAVGDNGTPETYTPAGATL